MRQGRQETMTLSYLGALMEHSARSKSFTLEMVMTRFRWETTIGIREDMEAEGRTPYIYLDRWRASTRPSYR